jgi:hypothetical protein
MAQLDQAWPEPKERPILFSGPMVLAILAGKKTQTRRVIKPSWSRCLDLDDPDDREKARLGCPHGTSRDRLWVRETFYCDDYRYPNAPPEELLQLMEYRADHDCRTWEAGCPCCDEEGRASWRPSIHMPRWASRITLEVIAVRVERVQSISEQGVIDEADEFLGKVWWSPAIDHRFCKRCKPHAMELASIVGRAIALIEGLRGVR